MKKILIALIFLSFIGVVYGEIWENFTDPNDYVGYKDINVTFNFPLLI
ncbi:hypothetical protein [Methanotorris formicicus]|uniref:Uncharacterized protein n=1 Tax=Methanotorris formicicus Mc-S-70 TaxID=647171 RepID=H1L0T5_9EURY|nr:hypothetical protein [Methanotorris formicicus]EHP84485.1 hypothetical protein MetfoDRAFT_1659 [Methanotorris formicicus Mc-S-70]